MSQPTYASFITTVMRLYTEGDIPSALRLVQEQGANYPTRQSTVAIVHICFLALTGDQLGALRLMQAGLDRGLWWSVDGLRGDSDLASLQGDPDFERMVAICGERHAQALQSARPERLLLPPVEGAARPYPLLVAMHPYSSSAADFAQYWQVLASQGWLVLLPQSSQIVSPDGYCWDNTLLAIDEIKAHLADITQQYPIDPRRTVVAGFSQGGGLALWLAVSQAVPAAGFIGLAPYLRTLDDLLPALPAGPIDGVRGVMFTGGQDRDEGMFDKMESLLQSHRIPYRRQHDPDLAHEIPPDFDRQLAEALAFILEA